MELTLTDDGRLNATSAFTVLLSDFSIHRDSLLGAAIADEVPVRVDLTWQLEAQPAASAVM